MAEKPLPHPPYSDEYVLPKTKYGIPVRPDQFVSAFKVLCHSERQGGASTQAFTVWDMSSDLSAGVSLTWLSQDHLPHTLQKRSGLHDPCVVRVAVDILRILATSNISVALLVILRKGLSIC